ncbi:hypothetical protein [Fulvivirga ligni]|uniref:hypothetical protein n=1 Tax=Fulvivirga ligni TaxID=2904246 RepID=UPI001F3914E1|nr:hypothetical protein [Fulvivirga ligni]UII18966.1 hypothetical protein LVD16_14065 [Fulvivirga ligni]
MKDIVLITVVFLFLSCINESSPEYLITKDQELKIKNIISSHTSDLEKSITKKELCYFKEFIKRYDFNGEYYDNFTSGYYIKYLNVDFIGLNAAIVKKKDKYFFVPFLMFRELISKYNYRDGNLTTIDPKFEYEMNTLNAILKMDDENHNVQNTINGINIISEIYKTDDYKMCYTCHSPIFSKRLYYLSNEDSWLIRQLNADQKEALEIQVKDDVRKNIIFEIDKIGFYILKFDTEKCEQLQSIMNISVIDTTKNKYMYSDHAGFEYECH